MACTPTPNITTRAPPTETWPCCSDVSALVSYQWTIDNENMSQTLESYHLDPSALDLGALEDVIVGNRRRKRRGHDETRVEYAIRRDYMVCGTLKTVDRWISGRRGKTRNREWTPRNIHTRGKEFRWHEVCGGRSLSPTFGFVVIILFVFPLVFIIVIKEVGRRRERPSAGIRDIAELELCLVYNSGSRLDINSLWWQKLLQFLKEAV